MCDLDVQLSFGSVTLGCDELVVALDAVDSCQVHSGSGLGLTIVE